VQGDPTEGALLVAARKAGLDDRTLAARWRRVAELPFSSERKLMSTVHEDAERDSRAHAVHQGRSRGAAAALLHELVGNEHVPLAPARRDALARENEALADQALRSLATACRPLDAVATTGGDGRDVRVDDSAEQSLVFLGLVGMIDPPRAEARDAVMRARQAGIRPILITGDHPRTAAVIAAELGISDDWTRDDREGAHAARRRGAGQDRRGGLGVRARRSSAQAAHRRRAAAEWRRGGDDGRRRERRAGLRAADIGIAMGITGTDVSKEAADMILADDDFATIVAAVEEGRGVYANIRRVLRFLLAGNLGEVITMFFAVLLAGPLGMRGADGELLLPLLATQILWINLVTDGAPALALGLDPAERGLMRRGPRRRDEGSAHAAHVARGRDVGPRDGARHAVGARRLASGRLRRRHRHDRARSVDGVHDARARAAVQRVQHASGGAERVRRSWRRTLDDRRGGAVARAPGAALYLTPLQRAFGATALSGTDWLICVAVSSAVLWEREIVKLVGRVRRSRTRA
jgi:Ca2+-transporting ATPase